MNPAGLVFLGVLFPYCLGLFLSVIVSKRWVSGSMKRAMAPVRVWIVTAYFLALAFAFQTQDWLRGWREEGTPLIDEILILLQISHRYHSTDVQVLAFYILAELIIYLAGARLGLFLTILGLERWYPFRTRLY